MAAGDWWTTNSPPDTTVGPPRTTMPVTPTNTSGPGATLIPRASPDPTWIPSAAPPGSAPGSTQLAVPGGGVAPSSGASGASGGTGSQDYAAIIKQLQGQFPPTDAGFQQLVQALNQRGIRATIATHADGTAASTDKVVLPDGTYYDIRTDSGWQAPGQPDHWDPSVPVVTPSGQLQPYGDYLQSQGMPVPAFNPRPDEVGGGSAAGGGQAGYQGPGGFGGLIAPFTGQFAAPDLTNTTDPGYLARLQMGTDAIQKSAAAKGTLLTGGTLKDLTQYAQDYASNEYGNVYNRALGTFNTNYGIFENNQSNAFNRLYGLTGLGLNAASGANAALGAYGTGLGNNAANFGNLSAGYGANASNIYQGIGNTTAAGQLATGQTNAGLVSGLGAVGAGLVPAIQQGLSSYQTPRTPPPGPVTGFVGPMPPQGYGQGDYTPPTFGGYA